LVNYPWFETAEKKEDLFISGYNKDNKPIYGTSHYITLDLLCKRLDFGIEVFAEESGCCFQQHFMVNHNGEIVIHDVEHWEEHWFDDDGNELDEPYETGGLDDYLNFAYTEEIYGE
jgi:hypothetical protein